MRSYAPKTTIVLALAPGGPTGSSIETTARRWRLASVAPPGFVERTLLVLRGVAPGTTDAPRIGAGGTGTAASGTVDAREPGRDDAARFAIDAVDLTMEDLVRDHADAVYRVALSVTRDPMLAEDASQDTLIKAWQTLPTFRGTAPLRNWVLRIAHNTSISLLRKRRDELREPDKLPERMTKSSVETQVQDRLAIDRFERALRDLDEISRSVVVLREVEGLSYDEICDVMGLPMPTVKTRLRRARRQLALALEGWQP